MTDSKSPFDEMFGTGETPRSPYQDYHEWFAGEDPARLRRKADDAERAFRRTGITFNVYGREEANERLIPFDIVPHILSHREWQKLSEGIEQRVRALNAFLHDIYHRQEIIKAGRIPREMISNNEAYLPKMIGVEPPGSIYTHIVGTDIVRTGEDEFYVLEDNARTPSGVSYMLENRETMFEMFPELFIQNRVQPVSTYPKRLRRSLAACAPPACKDKPVIAVLTPGIHNSAFFEHAFLAVLREFRPVFGYRFVGVDNTAVDQDIERHAGDALGDRHHADNCVLVPRLRVVGIAVAAPEINDLLSIDIDRGRGTDFFFENIVLGEGFSDARERLVI